MQRHDSMSHPSPLTRTAAGRCPACDRPSALRTIRSDTGRIVTCRFAELGDGCVWPGEERPFRRPSGDALASAFVERLAVVAERVIEECATTGRGTARIDPKFVSPMRAAIRRAARDRGLLIRTNHLGDGRIEVRTS